VPSYPSNEFIIPDVYAEGNGVSVFEWLQNDLSFSDEYLAKLIGADQKRFCEWKRGEQKLTKSQVRKLRNLSAAMTRLLSFLNFRRELMLRILEFRSDSNESGCSRFMPPWLGMSLREFMFRHGDTGVVAVDSWVQRVGSANSA
jgi:hypothetical protein